MLDFGEIERKKIISCFVVGENRVVTSGMMVVCRGEKLIKERGLMLVGGLGKCLELGLEGGGCVRLK